VSRRQRHIAQCELIRDTETAEALAIELGHHAAILNAFNQSIESRLPVMYFRPRARAVLFEVASYKGGTAIEWSYCRGHAQDVYDLFNQLTVAT
jgi:hypothetical protein